IYVFYDISFPFFLSRQTQPRRRRTKGPSLELIRVQTNFRLIMEGDTNENLLNTQHNKEDTLKNKIWTESKKMWLVAGPSILIRFSTFGISVICQAFVGHIGPTELAAYALIFTVILRFANSILLGMNSGLGTLCGQAYGAKQYHMLGIYLQQSWIVLTAATFLLSPLFIFTAPILMALGQDKHIAEMAGNVALWFVPAQSKNYMVSYLAVYSLFQHLILSWVLTVRYEFGVPGAMVSTILACWVSNFGQLAYVMFGGSNLMFFTCTLEFWYNTILVLLTRNMKNAEVTIDALSICLNISGWAVMISIGFMNAASVRVSNELGRKDPKAEKFSILMVVLTSFAIAFFLFVFFLLFRGCVANGAGRQGIVAYVKPRFILLDRNQTRSRGSWIGMIIGTVVQTVILVFMTYRTDWDKEVSFLSGLLIFSKDINSSVLELLRAFNLNPHGYNLVTFV
ncbi:MATE efflux family protein, partial [Striga asiatica]